MNPSSTSSAPAPLYVVGTRDHVELTRQKPVRTGPAGYRFPCREDLPFIQDEDGTLRGAWVADTAIAVLADDKLLADLAAADRAIAEAEDRLLAARDAHHAILVAAVERCPKVTVGHADVNGRAPRGNE